MLVQSVMLGEPVGDLVEPLLTFTEPLLFLALALSSFALFGPREILLRVIYAPLFTGNSVF